MTVECVTLCSLLHLIGGLHACNDLHEGSELELQGAWLLHEVEHLVHLFLELRLGNLTHKGVVLGHTL